MEINFENTIDNNAFFITVYFIYTMAYLCIQKRILM